MTLDDVFQGLRDRDAVLTVRDGALRYVGPAPLAPDDPLRAGIAEHRPILLELFTYAPGGRCVFRDGYRLLAEGDKIACPEHRRQFEETPMSWKEERERMLSAHTTTVPTPADVTDLPAEEDIAEEDDPLAGCCTSSRPCAEHFDDVFEAYRNAQEDRYAERGFGRGVA